MTPMLNTDHRTNRLLAVLEPGDFALLEPHLELVSLSRGQVLYEAGDIIRHAYFPHEAVISLVNVMEDGTASEVAVFGREAFGRFVVQVPGKASRIAFEYLNEIRNARPNLRQLIMRYAEAFLGQTFQTVSCNAVHPVDARCCRWILSIQDRTD